jgi:pimeloyl-ACP methyl ester carboxylesterase
MSTLHLDDLDLHYELHGSGPPLLLLHGFFGAGGDLLPFVGELGRTHQLIVPDLRGHGRSTNRSGTFTHRQCAADIAALLDALGIGRVRAFGLSGGGSSLLHLATQQPDRVEAMVLVSCPTHFPPQARAIQRHFALESLPPAELAAMRARHVRGEAQLAALVAQAHAFADDHDDLAFTPADLGTIRARTLILYGDRDELYPVEMAVGMYRAIPSAALWVLPNSGHSAVFRMDKGELLRGLGAFFDQP